MDKQKVWLHYIGKRVYDTELFMREVSKYGVSRAVSWALARTIRPGTPILLATYNSKKKTASVFGYFIVEGISIPNGVLDEAGVKAECQGENIRVERGCGSYTLSKSCKVNEDWDEVLRKLDKVWKEKHFKVFLIGRFVKTIGIELKNIPFTRGYMRVELPEDTLRELLWNDKHDSNKVHEIKDYQVVKHRSKRDREKMKLALDKAKPITAWLGGVD